MSPPLRPYNGPNSEPTGSLDFDRRLSTIEQQLQALAATVQSIPVTLQALLALIQRGGLPSTAQAPVAEDKSAYIPAHRCRDDDAGIKSHKRLKVLLANGGIRHEWRGKHLYVHAGDWERWKMEQEKAGERESQRAEDRTIAELQRAEDSTNGRRRPSGG